MLLQNHWKEAANILLLSPSTSPTIDTYCDYHILTIRGNQKSSILGSSYVFPGGQIDSSDFSSKWWPIFEKFGINENRFKSLTTFSSKRPPIIYDNLLLEDLRRSSSDEENFLPTDIALRIAAIRHTFQQTGILLIESLSSKSISLDEMNIWREKVSKNPNEFIELCDRFELNPDLWSLHEWWNWLTPSSVGRHPRYDSIFYICIINDKPTSESQNWSSPRKLLDGHIMQKYMLSPPQIYELSRLLNFFTIEEISDFAHKRQKLGIERWIPMLSMYSDGAISTLPGDDFYPKQVDLFATKPVRSYSQTLEEMRSKSVNLNRLELRASLCDVVVNIDLPFGHLRPVNSFSDRQLITAKL